GSRSGAVTTGETCVGGRASATMEVTSQLPDMQRKVASETDDFPKRLSWGYEAAHGRTQHPRPGRAGDDRQGIPRRARARPPDRPRGLRPERRGARGDLASGAAQCERLRAGADARLANRADETLGDVRHPARS